MTAVSAFNWKEYTKQEHAKSGDPFKTIKRNAEIGAVVTANVHRIRSKNPSHGTVFGLTEKRLNVRAPEMMETKRAKTKK